MIETRRATVNDVTSIVDELNKHISSCGVNYPKAEKEAVFLTVHSSFHHTSPVLTLLCTDGDRIIGISSVVASRYLWANQMQAEIRLVYVSPEYRGSRAFSSMLQYIIAWCNEKKCSCVSFEIASGINDLDTVEMMKKRGWEATGTGMVKRL